MARVRPTAAAGPGLKLVHASGFDNSKGTLQETVPHEKDIPKPKNIRDSVVLSRLWDEIVPEIAQLGYISKADASSLAIMIRHYHAALVASDYLIKYGPVTEGQYDDKKNPADVVFRSQSASFLTYAREHGMTLQARLHGKTSNLDDGDASNPFAAAR